MLLEKYERVCQCAGGVRHTKADSGAILSGGVGTLLTDDSETRGICGNVLHVRLQYPESVEIGN